ncbi:MAG TPA: hypothetical protein VG033_11735 [Candidatus Acidoferrales bacterium]|nr:hypothetical protein [Candidatus Acidoferrales bacterium]
MNFNIVSGILQGVPPRFWILAAVLLPALGLGQADPASLAHDRHEGLLVAADPYLDAARAKEIFGKANPVTAGILPVELFLKNEGQQPVRFRLETLRLVVELPEGGRQDLASYTPAQVAVLIAHPGGTPSPRGGPRLPVPVPIPSGDSKEKKYTDILKPLSLDADVVGPMSTLHGFVFFDLSHDFSLAAHASIYLPDVTRIPNQSLMYFEVLLRPAAAH